MTVAFRTFGCRLNRAEALDQEARVRAAGYAVVELPGERAARRADPTVIVVRGCSVTAKAQRDCEKEIARLRVRFPSSEIRIEGCLPEAPGGARPVAPATESGPPVARPHSPNLLVPMRTSRASLKVQDGCSGRCAFCVVPRFRGPPVSVPFRDVLDRARAFLAAGYRELVVTGCNLALYRSEGHGLADLLSALAELRLPHAGNQTSRQSSHAHRVRLGSLEPGLCDAAILAAFERHPNLCRFIHLSIQSGSDRVLRRMNRPYTARQVADFCAEAVQRLGPRVSLGADVIAGFPGETEEDHELTRRLLAHPRMKRHDAASPLKDQHVARSSTFSLQPSTFTNLHVFPYSERPGTPAATMDGALPRATRRARARELEALGRAQRAAFAQSFVGQNVEVCVERDGRHGWTAEYLPCQLDRSYPRRPLVHVHVKATRDSGKSVSLVADSTVRG